MTVQGMISDSHSPIFPCRLERRLLHRRRRQEIYGLICAPTTGGPYPVVIYNHGGTDNTNGGNITAS